MVFPSFCFYMFSCTGRLLQIEGHRFTFTSFGKSFFTYPQQLTRACFSVACESCFTRACVRSSRIATHRIDATAVRVGRTLVDICMGTSKLHRALESLVLYLSDSLHLVEKAVFLFLIFVLYKSGFRLFTNTTSTYDMTDEC